MSNNGKPWLNDSGCPDPTAYEAMKHIQSEEKKVNLVDENAHKVITVIKHILDLSGFELMERVQIRHRKSGRIYR